MLSSFLAFWLPLVSTVGCYQLFAAARIEKNNKETQLSTTNSHRSKEQRILRQQQHLQQKRQRQMKQTYKKNMKIQQQGNQTSNSQTLQENRMITSLPQNAARNILLTGNSNIYMLHCADDRFLLQLQLPKLLVIFFESQRFQLQDGANLQICAEHLTVLPAANEKSKLQSASNAVQMRSWLPTFAEKHRKVNEVQGEL